MMLPATERHRSSLCEAPPNHVSVEPAALHACTTGRGRAQGPWFSALAATPVPRKLPVPAAGTVPIARPLRRHRALLLQSSLELLDHVQLLRPVRKGAGSSADALVLLVEGAHVLPLLPEGKWLLVAGIVRQRAVGTSLAQAALEELTRHPGAFLAPGSCWKHLLDGLRVVGVRPARGRGLLRSLGGLLADLLYGGDVAIALLPAAFGRLVGRHRGRGPGSALRCLLRCVRHLHRLRRVSGVGRQGCRLLGILRRLLGHLSQRVQRVGRAPRLLRCGHGHSHGVAQLLGRGAQVCLRLLLLLLVGIVELCLLLAVAPLLLRIALLLIPPLLLLIGSLLLLVVVALLVAVAVTSALLLHGAGLVGGRSGCPER
mmetsp:Transcript_4040/g.11803  ORF Transcript_4040/g.11803 Transcript_4040/m.11803 type:complete len:372 (-) Transcript_4040:30-1145(-)